MTDRRFYVGGRDKAQEEKEEKERVKKEKAAQKKRKREEMEKESHGGVSWRSLNLRLGGDLWR